VLHHFTDLACEFVIQAGAEGSVPIERNESSVLSTYSQFCTALDFFFLRKKFQRADYKINFSNGA